MFGMKVAIVCLMMVGIIIETKSKPIPDEEQNLSRRQDYLSNKISEKECKEKIMSSQKVRNLRFKKFFFYN